MKLSTLRAKLKILNNRLQVLAKLKVAKGKLIKVIESIMAVEQLIEQMISKMNQQLKPYPENISLEDELKLIYQQINIGFMKLNLTTKEQKQGYVNRTLGRKIETMTTLDPMELCSVVFALMQDCNDYLQVH